MIQVAAGIAVVVWADRITNLIESDTAPLHIDASARDLQVLGFALVGVFVLLHGLQNIAATAYVWFSKPGWPHLDQADSLSYLWSRQSDAIVRALVQVIAGPLLIFGPKTIATAWSRLRGQSTNDTWDDSESDD